MATSANLNDFLYAFALIRQLVSKFRRVKIPFSTKVYLSDPLFTRSGFISTSPMARPRIDAKRLTASLTANSP